MKNYQMDRDTELNLVALERHLKLCREHKTYVDIRTLAYVAHEIFKDDTELFVKELNRYVQYDKNKKYRATQNTYPQRAK